MRKFLGFFFCVLAACFLASCDKDNSFLPKPLFPIKNKAAVSRNWSVSLGHGTQGQYLRLSPVLTSDGRVVVVDYAGSVFLNDAATGRAVWEHKLPFKVGASVAVSATGQIVVGGLTGTLVSMTEDSGRVLWTVQMSAPVLSAPVLANSKIFVHLHNDSVVALDLVSGKVLWSYPGSVQLLSLAVDSAPLVVGRQVFVGLQSGVVVSLNTENGQVLWSKPTALPDGNTEVSRLIQIAGSPLNVGADLFVASYHGNVLSLKTEDGTVQWEHPLSVAQGMTSVGGRLFVVDDASRLYALDQTTGKTLWMQNALEYRNLSSPVLCGEETVFSTDLDGFIHFFSIKEGGLFARERVSAHAITSAAACYQGSALVYTDVGELVSVRLSGN